MKLATNNNDINKHFQFCYVDAKCGQGKTYSAIKYMCDWLHEKNFMYVAPTINLLEQTYKDIVNEIPNLKPSVRLIHSNNSSNVSDDFYDHISTMSESGNIVLITWETFIHLEHSTLNREISIFIDEVPNVDKAYHCCLINDQ